METVVRPNMRPKHPSREGVLEVGVFINFTGTTAYPKPGRVSSAVTLSATGGRLTGT